MTQLSVLQFLSQSCSSARSSAYALLFRSYYNPYPRVSIPQARRYWMVCCGIFSASHSPHASIWQVLRLVESEVAIRFCLGCYYW
jgi:hypothetical protein